MLSSGNQPRQDQDLALFGRLDAAINVYEELSPGLPRAFHTRESAGVRFAFAECSRFDRNLLCIIAERADAEFEIVIGSKIPYFEIRTFFPTNISRDGRDYEEKAAKLIGAVNEIFQLIKPDSIESSQLPADVNLEDLMPQKFNVVGNINGRPRIYQLAHVAGVRFETKISKDDNAVEQLIDFADSFGVTATVENGAQGYYWHFQVIDSQDSTSSGVSLLPLRGMINLLNLYWKSFEDGTFPPSIANGVK